MPFRSKAQRRFMHARHPEMAKRWEAHTPKGQSLPTHVKDAGLTGMTDALTRFGLKRAGEELRLKIPERKFHGFDSATRTEADRGHEKKAIGLPDYGDRRSSEDLAQMLQSLEAPSRSGQPFASKDPLDRETNWGPPSNMAAGDVGGRSGLGQSTGFGGV